MWLRPKLASRLTILYVAHEFTPVAANLPSIESTCSPIRFQLASVAFDLLHILSDFCVASPVLYVTAKFFSVAPELAAVLPSFFAILPELLVILLEFL